MGGGLGGVVGSSPTPLERAERSLLAGPYFFEEIGERTPREGGSSSLEPHSLVRGTGKVVGAVWAWPAASKTNAHGPPTSSGGREKWSVDGRRKWETKRLLSAFSKGHLPTSPARPAGGRASHGPACEGRRPGILQEVQPPPHNPHQRGSPEGRTSFLWVLFPFLPKKWGPGWASQSSLPFQRRREKPTRAPRPGRPAVPTAPGPPTPSPRCPYSPKTATDSPAYPAGPPGAGRHRPPPPPGRCPPSSGRTRRGSPPGRRPAGRKRPG